MANVVRLVRGSYVPEVVLGGLTGFLGPLIWRHTATAVPTVTNLLEELLDSLYSASSVATPAIAFHLAKHQALPPMCFLAPPIQAMCATEPITPDQILRPVPTSRVETQAVPLPADLSVLPVQAMYTVEPIQALASVPALPGLSSATVIQTTSIPDSDPASSDLPPSAISSYLLSPAVILQLVGLSTIFIFVTNRRRLRWRSERVPLINKTENLFTASRHSAPRKLQRKPSDAPNWRIPRNESLKTGVIPPPLQSETVLSAPSPRVPRQRSFTAPPISTVAPPDTIAPITKSAIPSEVPAASLVSLPAPLTYIPPHKRASFDSGLRRPFADIGNGGNDRDWQTKTAFRTEHKRRLSSQIPLKTPSEDDFHRRHHRASLDMRRHVRANTSEENRTPKS
ncbi:hypothetical protein B0H12DRAFT_1233808 [Mycena haematopus]|nr:hypothetical protein B0H12DRAFT_1233808 [Mycena haematopus]